MTPRRVRCDSSDQRDIELSAEPIERNESSDHNDHRDRDDVVMTQARSAMTAIAALRPLIAMTLPAGCVAAPQR